MPLKIPDENVELQLNEARYFIPADWSGVHDIISVCGWWIGQVRIVQEDGARYVDWLYSYSLKFEGEE